MLENPSRRAMFAGLAAAGAAPAFAKAPFVGTQAPAYHRFKIGNFEATVISDGPLIAPEAMAQTLFVGLDYQDVKKTLAANFLDGVVMEQNALVLNTGDKLVLFDTGLGTSPAFGPTTGRLLGNLRAGGIDPASIDAVILTHAHPDHCWALMADNGARNFPNAQIYVAQSDFDFWTDEAKASHPELGAFITGTRKQLLPNRDRMVFVRDGMEVIPGVQAMAAPGHTIGHTCYMITSGGKTLCVAADLAHHSVVLLQHPRASVSFDTDGKQAADTRVRMFDMLAAQRVPLIGYHFPWPGIGHLAKAGDGYRYFAAPVSTIL